MLKPEELKFTVVPLQMALSASLELMVTAGVRMGLTVTTALPVKLPDAAEHLESDSEVMVYVVVPAGLTERVKGLAEMEIGLAAPV